MTNIDLTHLNKWLGNEQTFEAIIAVETANLMNATLNRVSNFQVGDILPPAWHWLYFHEAVPTDSLGPDGHLKLGDFLPPIPLPRRMWAGGRLAFIQPILMGEKAIISSTIKAITPKQGRTGQLCFVILDHEITVDGERRLLEEQTLVYREGCSRRGHPPANGSPQKSVSPAPIGAEFSQSYTPDPVMLFRYSALTFNSHRIHYDLNFCRNEEGYPDLVVHGPLVATLLLDLFRQQQPNQPLVTFTYRSHSPLFNPRPFSVNGRANGQVWAANHEGGLAMLGQMVVGD